MGPPTPDSAVQQCSSLHRRRRCLPVNCAAVGSRFWVLLQRKIQPGCFSPPAPFAALPGLTAIYREDHSSRVRILFRPPPLRPQIFPPLVGSEESWVEAAPSVCRRVTAWVFLQFAWDAMSEGGGQSWSRNGLNHAVGGPRHLSRSAVRQVQFEGAGED
eukprot:207669-Rhodomonas_salina.2